MWESASFLPTTTEDNIHWLPCCTNQGKATYWSWKLFSASGITYQYLCYSGYCVHYLPLWALNFHSRILKNTTSLQEFGNDDTGLLAHAYAHGDSFEVASVPKLSYTAVSIWAGIRNVNHQKEQVALVVDCPNCFCFSW